MAASVAPVVRDFGPFQTQSNHIFFKSLPDIILSTLTKESAELALKGLKQGLCTSSRYGFVLASVPGSLILIRTSDIARLTSEANQSRSKHILLESIPHSVIKSPAIGHVPNAIQLSHGDEYLAFDTVRDGNSFVLLYKTSEFLRNAQPFKEVKVSKGTPSTVSTLAWNPVETGTLAICCTDGTLYLLKIKSDNSVELNMIQQNDITCLCWSPKGKQLVVGRASGHLCQLKLDLTEAKRIPPNPGLIPLSVLWTSTTQFLVVAMASSVDNLTFMSLDLVKGGPPTYAMYGDIFSSEFSPPIPKSLFFTINEWSLVLAMTNTCSDVIVLGHETPGTDAWKIFDVEDSRRAGLPLDHVAHGAGLFFGWQEPVLFSDVEKYPPAPVLFVLSQRGHLSMFLMVNSNDTTGLTRPVPEPVPDNVVSMKPPRPAAAQQAQIPTTNVAFSKPPAPPIATAQPILTVPNVTYSAQPSIPGPASVPINTTFNIQPVRPVGSEILVQAPSVVTHVPKPMTSASSLPSLDSVAAVKTAIQQKLADNTITKSTAAEEADLKVLLEKIMDFESRLAAFKARQNVERQFGNEQVTIAENFLRTEITPGLSVMQDFMSESVATTNAQKEEVEALKERVLSHFGHLEYAKSLATRNLDGRYLHLLRTSALDPATLSRFIQLEQLHYYVKTQITAAKGFFNDERSRRSIKIQPGSSTQAIYMTLRNHAELLNRLQKEVNLLRKKVGLPFRKDVLETQPSQDEDVLNESLNGLVLHDMSNRNLLRDTSKSSFRPISSKDRITVEDLTWGIRSVQLSLDVNDPESRGVLLSKSKCCVIRNLCGQPLLFKAAQELVFNETERKKNPIKIPEVKPVIKPTIPKPKQDISYMLPPSPASIPVAKLTLPVVYVPVQGSAPMEKPSAAAATPQAAPVQITAKAPEAVKVIPPVTAIKSVVGAPVSSTPPPAFTPSFASTSTMVTTTTTSQPNLFGSLTAGTPNIFGSTSIASTVSKPTVQVPAGVSVTPVAVTTPSAVPKATPLVESTKPMAASMISIFGAMPNVVATSVAATTVAASNPPSAVSIPSADAVATGGSAMSSIPLPAGITITPVAPTPAMATSTPQPALTANLASSTGGKSLLGDPPAGVEPLVSSATGAFGSSSVTSTAPPQGLFSNTVPAVTSSTAPATSQPTSVQPTSAPSLFGSVSTAPVATSAASVPATAFGPQATTTNAPATSVSSAFGGPLFGSTTASPGFGGAPFGSTTSTAGGTGIFGASSPAAAVSTAPATTAFGGTSSQSAASIFGATNTVATPALTTFGPTTTAQASPASVFGSGSAVPTAFGAPLPQISSASLFGTKAAQPATTGASIFGSTTTQAQAAVSVFGTPVSTSQSPFGVTTTPQSNTGMFGAATTVQSPSGVFGAAPTAQSPTTSVFGTPQVAPPTGLFGSATSPQPSGTGIFGSSTQTSGGLFSASATTSPTTGSIFGGGGAPAGSTFGGGASFGTKPAFGTTAFGGSSFGSPNPQQSSSFGAQSPFGTTADSTSNLFGSSAFGLGATKPVDSSPKNIFGGGTFGANTSQSIFGSSPGVALGSASPGGNVGVGGAFSSGSGVGQSGFGLAQTPPPQSQSPGSGFGAAPVFGSAPSFGSSPLGTAFGSTSPASGFGTGTGIFGGGATGVTPGANVSFGSLAQNNPLAFGASANSPFNVINPSYPAPQPQPQQQQSGFGGNSFSSWR